MKIKEKILLLEIEELVAAVSAFLLVAAVFLPWGKTENVNILGIEGKDSMITIGMGLITLVLLLVKRISIIVPLVFGLFTLFIGGYDFVKMEKVTTALNGQVGIGLYLTIIASFGVIIGAAINAFRKKKNKKSNLDSSHGGGFRALASFLLFAIIFSGFSGWPMPKVALAAFDGGDGTVGNPYQISTCSQLQDMSGDLTANYILTGNVDCSATSGWNGGWGFLPVGSSGTPFSGTLNGHNHNISGFVIARAISYPTTNNQALFGYINSTAVISNVSMSGVSVTGAGYVAGLVAYSNYGTVTNCSVSGTVSGYLAAGLLVGTNYYGTISNSHTSGTSTVSYMAAGGLAGQNLSGTISSSYSTANAQGADAVGGLVGQNTDIGAAHVSVTNSYARGNVVATGNGPWGTGGGLLGDASYTSVVNSFSTGTVTALQQKGFAGWCNHNFGSPDSFVGDFWDTDTTGLFSTTVGNCGSVTGLLGKTTLQMKDVATYTTVGGGLATAWDFVGTPNNDAGTSDIWAIDPLVNDGYPHLTAFDPPISTVLSPADNATGISASTNLVLTLNKNVTAVAGKNIVVKQGLTTIESDDVTNLARVTVAGNIVTIDLSATLDPSTEYYVLVDSGAFIDEMGNSYAGISDITAWSFTTATPDVTAPSITTLTPLDNATDVSPNTNLTINFDENVVAVAGKYITVKQGGSVVESVEATDGGKVTINAGEVVINLASTLDWGTGYNVLIDAGAFTDAAANPITGISSATDWNFTVVNPPVVATLSPVDGATLVAVASNLVVTFDKNVNAGSGKFLYVRRSADDSAFESVAVDGPKVSILNSMVTIDLASNLDYSSSYYVTMDAGAFEDTSGNPFAGISNTTTWNFSTVAAPDVTAPTIQTLTPAANATGVSRTPNLVLAFDENVVPVAGHYIVLKRGDTVIQNTEVTNGALVTVDGTTATMTLSASLDYSTNYHVEVDTGSFQDNSGNPFLGISGTTWSFETLTPPDVTPPSINSVIPLDNSSSISVSGLSLIMNFNENVVAVGGKNIYLKSGATTIATIPVDSGYVSILGGTVTVTSPTLSYLTDYQILIDNGAFTDTTGNPFAGIADNTVWNFTTQSDPTPPPDVTPPSVNSFDPALDSTTNIAPTLVINFNENISAVGGKHIQIVQGDTVFQTLSTDDTANVEVANDTVRIHLGGLLSYSKEYHVLIDDGAFEDAAHNPYAGISDPTVWKFTTVTPTEISTCQQLQAMNGNLTGNYALTGDIDCQADTHVGGALWNGGLGFQPIGLQSGMFNGMLDGQGHAVKNLFINRPTDTGVGLVGFADSGMIINIGVEDANVTGGRGTGILAGYLKGIVYDSYSNGTATGTGVDSTGGLVGYIDYQGGHGGTIMSSYSMATVVGTTNVGGLVGSNLGSIRTSYSTGSVTGTSGDVGGLVGINDTTGTVESSYSIGAVTGGIRKGLCGENTGTITNSFWNTETSGVGDSSGGTGKTTLEMKTGSTYSDGNSGFFDTYRISASVNQGYPYLWWVTFPTVEFTSTSSSALESVTSVNLPVSMSKASLGDVTFHYTVTGGTATGSGTDYTLADGTETILQGETSVNIPMTVVNDSTVESDETVIVTISDPQNASLGSNTSFTYTITNDDSAPVDQGGGGGGSIGHSSNNGNNNNSNTNTDTTTTTTTTDSSSDNTNSDTVAQDNQTDKNAAEKDALEKAASSTVDLLKDQFTDNKDKDKAVTDKEISDALNKYVEDSQNKDSENKDIIDLKIVYSPGVQLDPPIADLFAGKITDPGEKAKAEDGLSKNAQNSISQAVGGSSSGLDAKVEGRNQRITSKTEVRVALSLREAQALRAVYAAERRDILVLDTSSDVDQDGVADYVQIQNNQPLFNPDPDNDKFSNRDEIFFGGDPKKADKFSELVPSKPRITNLVKNKENVVGSNPIFWIADMKIGDNFSVFIVDVKDSRKKTLVASGVIDAHFKSAVPVNLPDGDYFVFVKNGEGIGDVQRIKVDSKLDLESPSFGNAKMVVREVEVSTLGGVYAIFHRSLPSSVLALLQPTEFDQDGVITGKAKPGEVVYVTWKSMVLNSVVIADASSGEFQVQVPGELENGKHTALAYVVNGKNPWLSNINEMIFGKKSGVQ